MAAIKKNELEQLEAQYGLNEDGLTYQHRCSRITAVMKGEEWNPPVKETPISSSSSSQNVVSGHLPKTHPLYGKRILITPLFVPNKDRAVYYDEPLGSEMTVREVSAGEQLYGAAEDVSRMVADYAIEHVDPTRKVIAKSHVPKAGTEISWMIGKELVPVARGYDNKRGYIWSYPTSMLEVPSAWDENGRPAETSLIQVYGLKTLIRQVYPELESKFSGKPIMDYADGLTLIANIPQTHALLKKHFREEMMAQRAGLTNDNFGII